jgi:hypothetical protein
MTNIETPKLVVIESPFGSRNIKTVYRNIIYARLCVRDSFLRGEFPFASHLLYTQDLILDDNDSEERELGIEAGLTWGMYADLTAIYQDLGMTIGMTIGEQKAQSQGRRVERRVLPPPLKCLFDEKIKNLDALHFL